MKAPIFLSYRREDSNSEVIALSNALHQEFGEESVFVDTSSLRAGAVWPQALQTAVKAARVIIAVIGPEWLRAGSDEWGQRRIDKQSDWVRQELALALRENKKVIPVLVSRASMPPADVLPECIKALPQRQAIEFRPDYWNHDIKLLLAELEDQVTDRHGSQRSRLVPYPRGVPEGPDAINADKLQRFLETELSRWKKVISPLPEDPTDVRIELYREFQFESFHEAIRFMSEVSPGCDIAMHHPRWENTWKTIRVYLTTWDIGHRISDRDIQLARYFDRAYDEFPGAATVN